MASVRITCPDCKSTLRPAKPMPNGKKVKCPKCGNVFTSPGLVEDEEEAPRKKAPPQKAPKKKEKAVAKKAGTAKPPAKKSDFGDDDEGGGIYSFVGQNKTEEEEDKPEINYAPDMSIKDLRGPAQEAVVKPTNLIMLIGGLSALSNVFLICWSFWPMVFSETVVDYDKVLRKHYSEKQNKDALQRIDSYKEWKDVNEKDREIVEAANEEAISGFLVDGFPPMGRLWMMGLFIFLLIYNAIFVMGAVKMQNLESRRWGIAASIMMLLPMAAGGLSCLFVVVIYFLEQMTGFLGDVTQFYAIVVAVAMYLAAIYVGVMSLRVLFNQAVIDGFEYVAD